MLHLCRQVSVKMFGDIVWRRVTVGRIVSMSFACNKKLARRSLKPWMLFDGLLITNINIVLQQVSLRRNISINKIWLESINSAKSEQCSSGTCTQGPTSLTSALDSSSVTFPTTRLTDGGTVLTPDSGPGLTEASFVSELDFIPTEHTPSHSMFATCECDRGGFCVCDLG